jgi:hypothetical protein
MRPDSLHSPLTCAKEGAPTQTVACILVVVVENAADNAGVTGRCLLGPSFAETARKHGSSRSPSIGGARTVARAAATLAEPVSARPGANEE